MHDLSPPPVLTTCFSPYFLSFASLFTTILILCISSYSLFINFNLSLSFSPVSYPFLFLSSGVFPSLTLPFLSLQLTALFLSSHLFFNIFSPLVFSFLPLTLPSLTHPSLTHPSLPSLPFPSSGARRWVSSRHKTAHSSL